MKNKIEKKNLIIIFIILMLVLLISLLTLRKNHNVKNNSYEQAVLKKEETVKTLVLQDLSNKNEKERMEYYCAQFFKYLSTRDFEAAYDLLYSEYKENYFPTLASFKKYIIDYFPDTSINDLVIIVEEYKNGDAWKEDISINEDEWKHIQDIIISAGELDSYAPYDDLIYTKYFG